MDGEEDELSYSRLHNITVGVERKKIKKRVAAVNDSEGAKKKTFLLMTQH